MTGKKHDLVLYRNPLGILYPHEDQQCLPHPPVTYLIVGIPEWISDADVIDKIGETKLGSTTTKFKEI